MKRVRNLLWIVLLFCVSLWGAPYTDNGNETVTDSATGLIWQKCSNGQITTNCSGSASTLTWSSAITYCNGLTLAGRTWRLPNINELRTLVDYSKSTPSIDTTAFPSTESFLYWSSSTYAQITLYVWVVSFDGGNIASGSKTYDLFYVRCVTGP